MSDSKTERGSALNDCKSSNLRKVAHAASDYRYGMLHSEWAAENGSVDELNMTFL